MTDKPIFTKQDMDWAFLLGAYFGGLFGMAIGFIVWAL